VQAEAGDYYPPWINGVSLYRALASDPLKTVYQGPTPGLPIPNGAPQGQYHIAHDPPVTPGSGTDRGLAMFEPGGAVSDEMWHTYNNLAWVNVGGFSRHDLVNGDGFAPLMGFGPRAGGASFSGGLMRTWELRAATIRHALALALTRRRMTPSYIAPATSIDANHASYAGPVPMGRLVALAPDVSIGSLGLTSAAGRTIAQALQTYGAYVVDTGGSLALFAERSAGSLVVPARQADPNGNSDMKRIVRHLRCVSNNLAPSWGGGGTPLVPPPPPFG
jgi:hypothetical protein